MSKTRLRIGVPILICIGHERHEQTIRGAKYDHIRKKARGEVDEVEEECTLPDFMVLDDGIK